MHVCTRGAIGVSLTAGGGRTFAAGDRIDLEAEASPGLTWREALGDQASAFVLEDTGTAPDGRDQE